MMSLRMTCGVLLICFSNGDVRACLRPPQADSVVFSRCLMLTKVENPWLSRDTHEKICFFLRLAVWADDLLLGAQYVGCGGCIGLGQSF